MASFTPLRRGSQRNPLLADVKSDRRSSLEGTRSESEALLISDSERGITTLLIFEQSELSFYNFSSNFCKTYPQEKPVLKVLILVLISFRLRKAL
jgi:hypothetical protein